MGCRKDFICISRLVFLLTWARKRKLSEDRKINRKGRMVKLLGRRLGRIFGTCILFFRNRNHDVMSLRNFLAFRFIVQIEFQINRLRESSLGSCHSTGKTKTQLSLLKIQVDIAHHCEPLFFFSMFFFFLWRWWGRWNNVLRKKNKTHTNNTKWDESLLYLSVGDSCMCMSYLRDIWINESLTRGWMWILWWSGFIRIYTNRY